MNRTKSVLSAIALASAAFVSTGAQAIDISAPLQTIEIVEGEAFFGNLFTGNNTGNTFSDQYSFTTTMMGSLTADLFSMTPNANNGLDISGFGLYDASGSLLAGTQLSTGATDSWTLSSANLAAGTYYVQVDGSMVGRGAGKYYASIALAPVPEPETYAMMLAGLGLLGFSARRRQQKAAEKAEQA